MASDELPVILRLVTARALDTFGRAVISATVLWELYARTDSKLVLGAVGFVQVIPVVALFIPAGKLVDRSDRRVVTTAGAALGGIVGLGLAAASLVGAPLAVYFALLLVQGMARSVQAPASSSLIPLVISRGQLERTNRISSSLTELASIVGPALAGLALVVVAPRWVYAAVGVTGAAAAVMYRSLPRPRAVDLPSATLRVAARPGEAGACGDHAMAQVRGDWRVGLRYILRSRLLLPALTLDMFAVLFAGVPALLPAVASDMLHVGTFGYGLLRAAQSAGAVAMGILGGRIGPWRRPGRVLLIVVALFGAATVAFGLSTSFPLSIVLLVICGALDNISVVIRLTLEQMVVPDAIRGRVAAVHFVFIGMSNELGAAESGVAASLFGIVPAIVGGGVVAMLVVALVAWKWSDLSRMPPLANLRPPE